MGRRGKAYPKEFRRQMIDLVRNGRSPESLGREFEASAQAIRNWVEKAEEAQEETKEARTQEEEIRRLRRKNRRLREERDILKKARSWFARETEKKRRGPSSS